MRVRLLYSAILMSLLFVSCTDEFDLFNDDLDINSKREEFTFIYSNVSPNDSVHFIRINRGFIGGNFFDMSNCIDSIQYKPGDLSVVFKVIRNGRTIKNYVCLDTIIDKQPSEYFNTGKVRSYYFNAKDIPYEFGDVYKLVVKTKSNKEVTAETHAVSGFASNYYESYHGLIDLTKNNYLIVRVLQPEFGQVYDLDVKAYYHEILPGNIKKYYIKKFRAANIISDEFSNQQGNTNQIYLGYYAENIMTAVIEDVESRGTVSVTSRGLDSLSYVIHAGNNDMAFIYENKVPTTGFNIDNVGYSNVKNGYGCFTSYVDIISDKFGFTSQSKILMHDKYGEYGF